MTPSIPLTDEQARSEAAGWMLERAHLRPVFERLPPTCRVRGLVPLVCPAPGEVGWLVSYTDDGLVSVVVPGNPIRGFCKPTDLDAVEFHRGMTPEWVRSVFLELPGHTARRTAR